jgi:hypothetical protein
MRQPPTLNDQMRHMKGRQVAMSLYLPPHKYWLLKSASRQTGFSMQALARHAIYEYLSTMTRLT